MSEDQGSTTPEERVAHLLELVRDERLEEPPLAERVARTAGRQLRVKALAATLVDIAGAAGDLFALVVGDRRRGEGR